MKEIRPSNNVTLKIGADKLVGLYLFFIVCSSALPVIDAQYTFWNLQLYSLFFQLLVLLAGSILIIYSVKYRYTLSFNVIDILLISYLCYTAFNSQIRLSNINHTNSIYFTISHLFIYFLAKRLTLDHQRIKYIITPFVLFGILNVIICVLQLSHSLKIINPYFNINGTFLNPSQLGGFLVAMIPLLYFLFKTDKLGKTYFYPLLVIFLIFIVLSESRAALVASFALFTFEIFSFLNRHKKIIGSCVLLITLVPLGVLLYKLGPDSVKGRFLIWKVGWNMTKETPVTGLGQGAVKSNFALYQASYFSTGDKPQAEKLLAGNTTYLFNEPLEILVEQGVIGFFLFVALIYKITLTRYKEEINYFKYCALGIFIFGFWSYPFDTPAINLVFYMSLGVLSRYALNTPSLIKISPKINTRYFYCFVLFISLLCLFNVGTTIVKTLAWTRVERLWQQNEGLALIKQEDLKSSLMNNSSFMYNYLAHLVNSHYYIEAMDVYEKNSSYFHHNTNLHMLLGHLYEKINRDKESAFHYSLSSNIRPILLVPKYKLFNHYLAMGDENKAMEIAKDIMFTPIKTANQTANNIKNEIGLFLQRK